MFRADVIQSDLAGYNKKLDSYVHAGNTDFLAEISKAKDRVIQFLHRKGFRLRSLCIPLAITIDTLTEESDVGSGYARERLRLVINITETPTGTAVFFLKGGNESDGSDLATITTLASLDGKKGEVTTTFQKTYKYYKVSTFQDAVATIELYERTFEEPVIFESLNIVMRSLALGGGSGWIEQAEYWHNEYLSSINEITFGYDKNDDGSYDSKDEGFDIPETKLTA